MPGHISVNLINFGIITLSSLIGLALFLYGAVWARQHNIPVVGPVSNALLQVFQHA